MRERHALGSDLGASQIKSGLVSELGKVRFKRTYPTPVALGPAKIVATLQELASDLIILSRRHGIEVWGIGIGGGIIIEGRLYQGTHHAAGELGHTSINFSGKSCRCGRTGCLEAYASVPAMLNSAQALISESGNHSVLRRYKSSLTLTQLFGALRLGDRIARQVIDTEIEYLSSGLANLVNLLNPELIVG